MDRFRDRFGTAGLVIAVIALVAALGGTALAASGALTGKQKKEVKAIAKSFQGTGPAGAQGSVGPAGAKGDTGAQGGAGTNGVSVTSTESATTIDGTHCVSVGGSKFVSASGNTYACNGKKGEAGSEGEAGPEGSPWTAGGTLPPGETETGAWTTSSTANPVSISFGIPLTAAPTVEFHEPGYEGETGENCPGKNSEPMAKKGFLCIYSEAFFGEYVTAAGFPHSFSTGVVSSFAEKEEVLFGLGTWAVTAP